MSWLKKIEQSKFIQNAIDTAKRISLPGFGGVPIFDVAEFFLREIQSDNINVRAGSISFNIFLALFPLIIFLFTLIPNIPVEDFQGQLMKFLRDLLPHYTFQTIESTINDLIEIPRKGLTSLGFVMALFFASNGIGSMIAAFDKNNAAFKDANFLIKRMKAIGITILLTLILIITIILIIGGQLVIWRIIDYLQIEGGAPYVMLRLLEIIMFFFLTFNSIALIYYLAPSLNERWSYFSPGATFTTLTILLTTYGFGFFINNFNSYNRIYGSIGAIMAVMLLIYICSLLLIIGFELNASIALNKTLRPKIVDDTG